MKLFIEKTRDLSNMTGRRIASEALVDVSDKDEYLRQTLASELR
jgi:hypothetical protein